MDGHQNILLFCMPCGGLFFWCPIQKALFPRGRPQTARPTPGPVSPRSLGPLMGGGGAMSHVNFKKLQYPLSLYIFIILLSILQKPNVPCRFSERAHVVSLILFLILLCSMSHVSFKKSWCLPVDFRGHGPYPWAHRRCASRPSDPACPCHSIHTVFTDSD